MNIRLLAIGTKMPAWVRDGFAEYAKRLGTDCKLELIELTAEKRHQNYSAAKLVELEGERIGKNMRRDNYKVILDVKGKALSTADLAAKFKTWRTRGANIDIVIGGADGLSRKCLEQADEVWSLSQMTIPHYLVRVVVAEQIYRAFSILRGHPYHR